MKKFLNSDLFRLFICFFVTISFIIAACVYSFGTKDYYELLPAPDSYVRNVDIAGDWTDLDGKPVSIDHLYFPDYKAKSSYMYKMTLPEDINGEEAICFLSYNMSFAIYFVDEDFEGTKVNEYNPDLEFVIYTGEPSGVQEEFDNIIDQHVDVYSKKYGIDYCALSYCALGGGVGARGSGTNIHTMPLYDSDSGDTIYLELFPIYNSSSLTHMRISSPTQYIRREALQKLPSFITSLFIFVSGISILILGFFIPEKSSRKMYSSLAAFMILIGLWCILETRLLQILTGSSDFLNALHYYLLMMIAYPAAVFSDSSTIRPHKKISGVVFAVSMILMFGITFLNYRVGIDYHQTIVLFDALILAISVIAVWRVYSDNVFSRKNDLHLHMGWLNIGEAILSLCGTIDALRYIGIFGTDHLVDNSFFTRIGLIAFLIGMVINLYLDILRQSAQADKAGTYMELAYTDAMTGLPNRAAFINRESELAEELKHKRRKKEDAAYELVVVSMDLNGLKKVNDNLGHAMGDNYIKSAGHILMQSLGEIGAVYRIGGDEFAAFISGNNSEEKYNNALKRMLEFEKEYNSGFKNKIKMEFAYGHSVWKTGDTRTIEQVETDADNAMYEKKREMKGGR